MSTRKPVEKPTARRKKPSAPLAAEVTHHYQAAAPSVEVLMGFSCQTSFSQGERIDALRALVTLATDAAASLQELYFSSKECQGLVEQVAAERDFFPALFTALPEQLSHGGRWRGDVLRENLQLRFHGLKKWNADDPLQPYIVAFAGGVLKAEHPPGPASRSVLYGTHVEADVRARLLRKKARHDAGLWADEFVGWMKQWQDEFEPLGSIRRQRRTVVGDLNEYTGFARHFMRIYTGKNCKTVGDLLTQKRFPAGGEARNITEDAALREVAKERFKTLLGKPKSES